MKFRIIIAEDERRMAELIEQLGHWNELNIEVVDICFNGVKALESIKKNKPNIVLTDIKMPGHDGIELIAKSKEFGMDIAFIIISGYKHFEYAKSAMQYGVIDYLLKPIDEIQLNETLKKACLKIEEGLKIVDIKNELDTYKKIVKDNQYNSFWEQLLSELWVLDGENSLISDTFSVSECNNTNMTRFLPGLFEVLCIRTNMDGILAENSLYQEKVEEIILHISQGELVIESYISIEGVFVILNFKKEIEDLAKQSISALFYGIKNLTELYGSFSITIGCSLISESICELPQLFREAIGAENGRLIYGSDKILSYRMIRSLPHFLVNEVVSKEMEVNIKECYELLKLEELKALQEEIIHKSKKFKSYNPWDMTEFQMYLVDLSLCNYIDDEEKKKELRREIILSTNSMESFEQLLEVTFHKLMEHFKGYIQDQRDKRQQPVIRSLKYIDKNYAKLITLEIIAEIVGLSPAYFSKLFKTEVGKGFAEYLIDLRIEKSKKMLAETTDSIKTVALKVGYMDDKYFSKLFKKKLGIKPTDYRKLYS